MPYQAGARLPGERASRLGHLDVLKSPLVKQLIDSFEGPYTTAKVSDLEPIAVPTSGTTLPLVFGVDGSLQIITSELPPHKRLAFIKTALLRLDSVALARIDRDAPHPLALRDLLADSALYHATVLPLRHVGVGGENLYDAVRRIIYESMKDDSLNGEPFETFKWIVYEKWSAEKRDLPAFECPHCGKDRATLPYDANEGTCVDCGGTLLVTDMLGFHQEMSPESAPETVSTAYMNIHETLLLFTGIRVFWESNREALKRSLFVKDGPLSIRAQYSKLVNPIRRFLAYAKGVGVQVHIVGQEKTGAFVDHLTMIGPQMKAGMICMPSDKYIKEEIHGRPNKGAPYGKDTNYGSKFFFKVNSYHQMVLSIPTGEFKSDPGLLDLIGVADILSTLPQVLSNRHEGALLPIELAHGVASLSTYPSAKILQVFSDSQSSPSH